MSRPGETQGGSFFSLAWLLYTLPVNHVTGLSASVVFLVGPGRLVALPATEQRLLIKINPRLTTSYVGLRILADFNLAEVLLAVATGRPLPAWRWRAGAVEFSPMGR
jgi:hypothetical protein